MYYLRGQGPIKVLDVVRRVKRGGYGSGTTIYEGKGQLKSWTLRNGLGEEVMGQGLAVPPCPPPTPGVRTRRPGSGVCPLCPLSPPMAASRAPRAPCGCQRGARPL